MIELNRHKLPSTKCLNFAIQLDCTSLFQSRYSHVLCICYYMRLFTRADTLIMVVYKCIYINVLYQKLLEYTSRLSTYCIKNYSSIHKDSSSILEILISMSCHKLKYTLNMLVLNGQCQSEINSSSTWGRNIQVNFHNLEIRSNNSDLDSLDYYID